MNAKDLNLAVLSDPPFEHPDIVAGAHYFAKLVRRLQPNYVVELGTGRGRTAAQVMAALPQNAEFATINWPNPPSGDEVGAELYPWRDDFRLLELLGDTRDPGVAKLVDDHIDLLYIDSGTEHTYALISAEWTIYEPKLSDGAVVVCDDINHNDMRLFWDPLPYDKCEIWGGNAGLFIWRAE